MSRKDGEAQSDEWGLLPRAQGSVSCAEDCSAPGELGLYLSEGKDVRVVWRSGAIPSLEVQCSFPRSEYLQVQAYEHKPASFTLSVYKCFLPLKPSAFL